MAKVIMSPAALQNLRAIHEYISQDAESYADRVVDKIVKRISVLELYPLIGKIIREFENPLLRELIEGNYRIIYEVINENEISVLRIYHGARLLKRL